MSAVLDLLASWWIPYVCLAVNIWLFLNVRKQERRMAAARAEIRRLAPELIAVLNHAETITHTADDGTVIEWVRR